MALDNKNLGDKLYAFETNGIIKAIRTLFSNFLDKWGYLGNSGSVSSCTVPDRCNYIVVTVYYTANTFLGPMRGQTDLILTRVGKNTATAEIMEAVGGTSYSVTTTLTWSGNTLSTTNGSFVAYFYS
ncbi:MAG: hypothetical protein UW68_C0026G0002 [Candidatus Collierbacteria bacterium GW2011_GWB1_44_6]|uniref:Uncharacterized protein n=2 Tax=Candidatus Collieribacteriota TaxID=1752725 RepID=A0A0G1JN05_9BACT|nr:MAG: hypothetical protein UV68_C0053G0002 [Candidatus Collierbacteria bacterium GW2011_GWC2_43_12]KKT72753.1 MAG: hypothetical protein UW68_C0026G0002 [Candidatus Collierbacteria bacterium GW2011_GWB1_44_6]